MEDFQNSEVKAVSGCIHLRGKTDMEFFSSLLIGPPFLKGLNFRKGTPCIEKLSPIANFFGTIDSP